MIRGAFKNDYKNGGHRTRFIGLLEAAQALGVNRNHLYQVLSGRRISVSLRRKVKLVAVPGKPGHKKVEIV